jgi:hypothetical protein
MAMLTFRYFRITPFLPAKSLACAFVLLSAASLHAKAASPGIAWKVQGTWQEAGESAPIRVGDAIQPASLLQPDDKPGDHSITILLPDGQRILYECFTAADCARGFRVPSLHSKPDAFAVEMLARIRAVLTAGPHDEFDGHRVEHAQPMTRAEELAVLDANGRVHLAGRLVDLPNGRYTYDLRPLNQAYPPQFHLAVDKAAPSIELALPASGLYVLTISDALNTPRIDLFLAAIKPMQTEDFDSFGRAKRMMLQWNEDYSGWPIDDFLRAYLQSLMPDSKTSLGDRVD